MQRLVLLWLGSGGCVWITPEELEARRDMADADTDADTDTDADADADTDTDTDTDTDDTGDVDTADSGDSADTGPACDLDGDGAEATSCGGDDCDDGNAAIHPGADESCNEVDDDCDGATDEDAIDAVTFYEDGDGDGYGNDAETTEACTLPERHVEQGGDCNDADPAFHPGADESCDDATDYNCDGSTGYDDADGDGWAACEECNDADAAIFPGATEVCNGVDDDCSGSADSDAVDRDTWYRDADGDGYGDAATTTLSCDEPSGYVADDSDCNDGWAAVNPGAAETCNDTDDDCDGGVDEAATDMTTWYADDDADGYGWAASSLAACDEPAGYADNDDDCDDGDGAVNPAAREACDGVDNDCDGYDDGPLAVPSVMGSIQDAVDAAVDGDLICVEAGTYYEQVDLGDLSLELVGAGSGTTTIESDGSDRALRWYDSTGAATLVLSGFTLTGGEAVYGAGAYLQGGSATLDDVVVESNTCSTAGDCVGTGLYLSVDADLTDVTVRDNQAAPAAIGTTYVYGVGIYGVNVDGTWTGVTVTGNQADVGSATSAAYLTGVGIALSGGAVDFDGLSVTENVGTRTGASLAAVSASGGGLAGDGSVLGMVDAAFTENTLSLDGASDTSVGAGVYGNNLTLSLSQSTLFDQALTGASAVGATMYLAGSSDVTISNAILANSTASATSSGYAAVSLVDSAQVEFTNVDLFRHTVGGTLGAYGGALYLQGTASVTLNNTILSGNTCSSPLSTTCGKAIFVGALGASVTSRYSDYYDNGNDDFSGMSSVVGSNGNIAGDPVYASVDTKLSSSWDFTLGTGSACANTGDPAILDVDGSRSDMGGYGGPNGSWP